MRGTRSTANERTPGDTAGPKVVPTDHYRIAGQQRASRAVNLARRAPCVHYQAGIIRLHQICLLLTGEGTAGCATFPSQRVLYFRPVPTTGFLPLARAPSARPRGPVIFALSSELRFSPVVMERNQLTHP
ncbi:hypothetical protein MTO96_013544 [Rhipicephalus appendiculatus]